jgi:hypothetical protein
MTTAFTDDHLHALAILARGYWLQRYVDEAATLFGALDALRPHEPATLIALAAAQIECKRPEEALAALDRHALFCAPDRAAYLLRAKAFKAMKRDDDAQAAVRRFHELTAALGLETA